MWGNDKENQKNIYIENQQEIEEIKKGMCIEEGMKISDSEDDWIAGYIYFNNNSLFFVEELLKSDLKEPKKIKINFDDIVYYTSYEDCSVVVKTINNEYTFGNLETYEALYELIPEKDYKNLKNNKSLNNNDKDNDIENDSNEDNNDEIAQLEKLAELKEKGIITQEEFEESKKKILSKF